MLRTLNFVLLVLLVLPSVALGQQAFDVYIIAGQSNADGRGQASDLSSSQLQGLQNDAIISYLNPGSERERANPVDGDLDAGPDGFQSLVPGGFSVASTSSRTLSQTFGPELSFGAAIGEATGTSNQIAIIKVTRGGTNLGNDWLANPNVDTGPDEPEGFLYRALLEYVADSLAELEADGSTATVKGFLWHQGESDSNAVSAYAGRFVDLVEGVRGEFGNDIPFVLGELSRTRVNSEEFNNNLPNVASSAPGLSIVSSEGLTTPVDDTTHFDAYGQVEFGQRFAAAFAALPPPQVEVVFDFSSTDGVGVAGADPTGANFESSVAGDVVTVGGLTATIVDITVPEYDVTGAVPVPTGNTLSSAAGDANVNTNVSNQLALGIRNPSVSNALFDIIGDGTESSDWNPGETLTFTFDQAVQFTSIELESVLPDDQFNVLIDGVPVLETTGDDAFIDDLGGLSGLTIAAGSEITFAVDGVLETVTGGPATSLRIESFTVETVEATTLLGDVNQDGTVNFLDISPFIAVLSSGGFQVEADVDQNGAVNFLDISPFIAILSGT